MTSDQDILSFQRKVEERDFVLDDRLLAQLIAGKMERLRKQSEFIKQLQDAKKRR
jgi:hypothetical protein